MDRSSLYRRVATLHAESIDRGFISTLGIPFIALMYQAIDESRDAVLLVEERDGVIVGFVSGGHRMRSIYRRLLARPVRLGLALLPSVFRPRRLVQIIETMRQGAAPSAGLPEHELFSIAVDPQYRGKQIAEALFRRLSDHFRADGVDAFRIIVGESLAPAHRFYRRLGAEAASKIKVHSGECSIVYVCRVA